MEVKLNLILHDEAQNHGISIVHQEADLFPSLTVQKMFLQMIYQLKVFLIPLILKNERTYR